MNLKYDLNLNLNNGRTLALALNEGALWLGLRTGKSSLCLHVVHTDAFLGVEVMSADGTVLMTVL